MTPLDIVFVSTWPPTECGIATYTRDLAAALIAKGHRVTVLAEKLSPDRWPETDPPNVHRLWHRRSAYGAPGGLGGVAQAITQSPTRPSIIHIQHEYGIFPGELRRFVHTLCAAGHRVILTLHTVAFPPFYQSLIQTSELTEEYIVHSTGAAAVIAAANHAVPVHVIPHGTTLRDLVNRSPSTEPEPALMPGFMSPGKNHHEVLEGFARAGVLAPKLRIAGRCRDEHYFSTLWEAVARYGLTDRVELLDTYVPEEAFHKQLALAPFVVLGADKTTPLSASGQLHQALGAGIPVLAKDVPIYRSVPGGVLYYRSAEELAVHIQAMTAVALRRKLAEEARLAATSRTWDLVADMHLDVYRNAPQI